MPRHSKEDWKWVDAYRDQFPKASIKFPYEWFDPKGFKEENPNHPLVIIKEKKPTRIFCAAGPLLLYTILWSRKQVSIKSMGFMSDGLGKKDTSGVFVVTKQGELAHMLLTSATTINNWLDWLENAKLIRRRRKGRISRIFVFEPSDDYFDLIKEDNKVIGWDDKNDDYCEFSEEPEKEVQPETEPEEPEEPEPDETEVLDENGEPIQRAGKRVADIIGGKKRPFS